MVLPVTALQIDAPPTYTLGVTSGANFLRIFSLSAGAGSLQAPLDLTSCTCAFSIKASYAGAVLTTGTATVLNQTLNQITVTNQGGGFTSVPVISFSGGGGGTGAAASAVVKLDAVSPNVTVSGGGTLYTSAPSVSLVGGNGSGATAVATVSGGAVASVVITNQGSGYTVAPTVVFTGGGGAGATASCTIGVLTGIVVTSLGSGYSAVPGVVITGGGGAAAAATATTTSAISGMVQVTMTTTQTALVVAPAGQNAYTRDITNAGVWDLWITDGGGVKMATIGGLVTLTRSAQ